MTTFGLHQPNFFLMKKIFVLLAAMAAFSGAKAQNLVVTNNSPCNIEFRAMALEMAAIGVPIPHCRWKYMPTMISMPAHSGPVTVNAAAMPMTFNHAVPTGNWWQWNYAEFHNGDLNCGTNSGPSLGVENPVPGCLPTAPSSLTILNYCSQCPYGTTVTGTLSPNTSGGGTAALDFN